MLLLQIKNNIKKHKNLLNQIDIIKETLVRLKEKKRVIESFSKTKSLIEKKTLYNLKTSEIIKHIIGVSFLKKNTILYITDISGKLKCHYSAGSLKLNKKQKTKIPFIIVKLMKVILLKIPDLKNAPVSVHLNNVSRSIHLFFESVFKTQFFVAKLVSFMTFPHNGCRPKKLKRKKRKKIYF